MDFTKVKAVAIPEGKAAKIRFVTDLAGSSIDTDGSIYNGCGYLDGYRLSSNGAVKEHTSIYTQSTVTGFIPVGYADVIYIGGCYWLNIQTALDYICAYDSNFNFIGAEFSSGVNNGIFYGTKFIERVTGDKRYARAVMMGNADIAYIRVSCISELVGQTISGANIRVGTRSNALTVWQKSLYTNQVPISVDTDGSIYNGTGCKDGYRLRSGGAEAALAGARHTGFIPVAAGDTIRLTGWNFAYVSAGNAVNFSDAAFTNLGQFTMQPSGYGICLNAVPAVTVSDGIYQFTVPDNTDIRYMRVTGYHNYNTLPPDMIVTVNEEIKEE